MTPRISVVRRAVWLPGWYSGLYIVVKYRKFLTGKVFFSHTNQPAVLLHEPANWTGRREKNERWPFSSRPAERLSPAAFQRTGGIIRCWGIDARGWERLIRRLWSNWAARLNDFDVKPYWSSSQYWSLASGRSTPYVAIARTPMFSMWNHSQQCCPLPIPIIIVLVLMSYQQLCGLWPQLDLALFTCD